MKNLVQFKTATTTREPTDLIWADCPVAQILERPGVGWHRYVDFRDFSLTGTQTTQIGYGGGKVFATSGSSFLPISAVNSVDIGGGLAKWSLNADNDSVSWAEAYPAAKLSGNTSDSGKLWFECCIAVNSLLTATMGFFLGLAETNLFTLATGVPFNASSQVITNGGAMIGWQKSETGLGVINTVVSDRATSFTSIQASAGTISAAYTFTKLGFVYDPGLGSNCIQFYQDGVLATTVYSKTSLQANTNLNANALGFLASTIAAASVSTTEMYMKWFRISQLYPGAND